MTVRSLQIAQARVTATGLTTIYTCPAGKTTIIKAFSIYTSGAVDIYLGVQKGAMRTYFCKATVGVDGILERTGQFVVLEPGDTLVANSPGGITYDVLVSGAELAGVAP